MYARKQVLPKINIPGISKPIAVSRVSMKQAAIIRLKPISNAPIVKRSYVVIFIRSSPYGSIFRMVVFFTLTTVLLFWTQ